MKNLEQSYEIQAPIKKVWQALTDPKIIDQWGGGPAEMDAEVGTNWKLWGGDIWGKNIEVEPNKKLAQEWFSGPWPTPSICTFELSEHNNQTTVKLTHTNIPTAEFDDVESGWREYYLGPLKELLENETGN